MGVEVSRKAIREARIDLAEELDKLWPGWETKDGADPDAARLVLTGQLVNEPQALGPMSAARDFHQSLMQAKVAVDTNYSTLVAQLATAVKTLDLVLKRLDGAEQASVEQSRQVQI